MAVCSQCGSEKVEFRRERTGSISNSNYSSSSKRSSAGVRSKGVGFGSSGRNTVSNRQTETITGYRTVGFCKDCGNTWVVHDDFKDANTVKGSKKKWLLLCGLGGIMGLHRFCNGEIGKGFLYMFTGGLIGIGWIRDFIIILKTPSDNFR